MNKRLVLVAVAVVGLVAVATWSAAQSPSDKTPPAAGGSRARLTSSTDSSRANLERLPLRSAPLPGDSRDPDSSPGSLASATEIRIDHALVTSVDPIQLPAREAGAIVSLINRKGEVKAGDVLGQLYDLDSQTKKEIAELERDAAKLQADSTAQIDAATKGEEVTRENYLANQEGARKNPGAISAFDMRRSLFEWERAKAQIKVAEVERSVAQATELAKVGQIKAAELEIERRKIIAPMDGIVTEIYKHQWEWCQPGDPILELVRMDRVEIEGFVYAADASPSKIVGKPVEIVVHLAGGETYKTSGTIEFASPVLEGSGRIRQFRISTRIDNKKDGDYWVIQPGSEAEMTIQLVPPKPVVPAKTTTPGSKGVLKGTKVESYKPALPDKGAKMESKTGDKADAKSSDKADSKATLKTETASKADEGKSAKDNRLPAKLDSAAKTTTKTDEKGTDKSDKESPKTPTKIKL